MVTINSLIRWLAFSVLFVVVVVPLGTLFRTFNDRHRIRLPVSSETYFNFRR